MAISGERGKRQARARLFAPVQMLGADKPCRSLAPTGSRDELLMEKKSWPSLSHKFLVVSAGAVQSASSVIHTSHIALGGEMLIIFMAMRGRHTDCTL